MDELDGLMKSAPLKVDNATQQQMLDLYLRFTRLYFDAGGDLKPKHHQLIHMFQRIWLHGNPRFTQTYRDESLNGIIGKIARSCHYRTFQRLTHHKFDIMQRLGLNMDIY